MKKRTVLGVLLCGLLCLGATQAQAATKLAVLSFTEHGQISKGAGQTLAMLLASSLDARRYHLLAPQRLKPLLSRHRWFTKRSLTPALLRDLSKLGVRLILTGGVSSHYKVFTTTYRAVALNGRVLHSEVLPPVNSWAALVSSLRYSVRMLLRRNARTARAKKKKKASKKKKKTAKKKKKKKKKKKSKRKAFAKVVKGMKRMKGLFPLWIKKDAYGRRKIYMEISPKQLNKIFLVSPTLEGGIGASPFLTFAQLPEYPIEFRVNGKYLMAVEPNVRFRANKKAPISRVMKRSFADTVRAATPILSQPHPKTKAILISFKSLFMKQIAVLTYWIRYRFRYYKRTKKMSTALSRIYHLKNYPKNLEMGFRGVFGRYGSSIVLPDGKWMILKMRYSISERPSTSYRPRLADDRVGHFLMIAKDYSKDKVDTRYIRYVTRWHLEKKYPKKKLSVPKKPIVFWLENAIPHRYRKAVAKGITIWNDAFKIAGFKKAIVAKQQPNNAKWDGADVRYNTIRWFAANRAGFAQGPSRIDPLTGQIYDADIRVDADIGRYIFQQLKLQINPLRWMGAPGMKLLMKPFHQVQGLAKLESTLRLLKKKAKHGHQYKGWRSCNFGHGHMVQAALGWHLLQLRGALPNPNIEKKFVDQFMISLIAHEVGHTLGLRHNFKASTLHDMKQLHDAKRTRKMGLTNSMMEYTPVNLALPGQRQGEYWQTTLGPYDKWAIEYAYTPFPKAKTILAERPYLNKIARRVAQHSLQYGTDEDALGSASPLSIDPTTMRWDLGKEPLNYYKTRVAIANELWKRVEKKFGGPKSSYQRMRQVFNLAMGTYMRAGVQAAKYFGGIYHRRDHIGDPGKRLPFEPVPAAKQRKALDFLIKNYFASNAFKWSAGLLNKLQPNMMWDFSFSVWGSRKDYPVHQIVLMVQLMPLARALHPAVLDRIVDTKLRLKKGASHFSLQEMFGKITKAVWSELDGSSKPTTRKGKKAKSKGLVLSSARRNFQWYHLQYMSAYTRATYLSTTDPSSIARIQLINIASKLNAALRRTKDAATRGHFLKCLNRIRMVLKPRLISIR